MARRLPTTHNPVRHASTPSLTAAAIDQNWRWSWPGHLACRRLHSEQTLTPMGETVTRLAVRLAAQGITSFTAVVPDVAAGFVHAQTGPVTARCT
jgi:hypothetical protein